MLLFGLLLTSLGYRSAAGPAHPVLVAGVLISVLATGATWSLTHGRSRALELADRMTAALGESEERLTAILDGAADAIVTYDTGGAIHTFNRAAERIFGYRASQVHGRSIEMLVPHSKGDPLDGFRNQSYGRRSNGPLFPIEISVSQSGRGDGALFIAIMRDVTERRRAEEALRESEARYRDLFENASDLIQATDVWGRFLYTNRAWRQTLGYDPLDVGHLTFFDTIEPDERDACRQLFDFVMKGGELERLETTFRTKDGREVLVEGSLSCRIENGKPVSTRAIFRDVSARHQAEEALKRSEARTRSIIQNMLGGLLTTDEEGRIETVNLAAERIFGYRAAELEGRHLRLLIPDTVLEPEEFLKDAYRKAVGRVTEWEGRRKSGEVFPLELSLFEFHTESGRHFAGNVQDISERREVERLKNEFVSTVSHELRTPLASIRGSLSLMRTGALGDLPADAIEVVEIAERNTVRLVALINDILDLERLSSGRIEMTLGPVAAATIIDRAIESVAAVAAQRGVPLVPAGVDGTVNGDEDRLVQVLVNLLSNAVKFSPGGESVRIAAIPAQGLVEFRVTDRGRGIPREHHDTIFDRFRQVESSDSREKGGTGLGLAICKAIVEQHAGSIGVDSEPGRGSSFWVRVPSDASPPVQEAPLPPPGEAAVERPDVLVAEGDASARRILERLLNAAGASTRAAATGSAVVREVLRKPPSLLVLDAGLPESDGFSVVEALRGEPHLRNLALLVYTARELTTEERGRLILGPTRFLTKGRAGEADLRDAMRGLLGAALPQEHHS